MSADPEIEVLRAALSRRAERVTPGMDFVAATLARAVAAQSQHHCVPPPADRVDDTLAPRPCTPIALPTDG